MIKRLIRILLLLVALAALLAGWCYRTAVAAMRRLPGARVLLSHSPDPFPTLPGDIGLMLAGHTHCG